MLYIRKVIYNYSNDNILIFKLLSALSSFQRTKSERFLITKISQNQVKQVKFVSLHLDSCIYTLKNHKEEGFSIKLNSIERR